MALVALILLYMAGLASTSWWAMLAVGAAHSTNPAVPAIGYDTTVWLVATAVSVVGLAININRQSERNSK